MVANLRNAFNAAFTPKQYNDFLDDLNSHFPDEIDFRVAETPIYVDKAFTAMVLEACESIVDVIVEPNFKSLTENAIPADIRMQGETERPECIAFDFGICDNGDGKYIPQLIEMQGFPSLFAYQILHTSVTKKHFPPPTGFNSYLSGYTEETYIKMLKDLIAGDFPMESVILLEIYPETQKTRIDFACTKAYLGINTVCLTKLKAIDNQLFYELDGQLIRIQRIYNRLIFDDLATYTLPKGTIDIRAGWEVEWCPHPHWFYRISKFTLPFIDSPYVPYTQFLHLLNPLPADLHNYVLKPLFSFAGQGVIIDVTLQDIAAITDPENWILQRKVKYADAILTKDVPAKAEIRVFYFWPKACERPFAAQNLARLSKGKMIGVRYNADKEWVGGSLVFFEQ